MMTSEVAEMAVTNDYWGYTAVGLVALYCAVSAYLTAVHVVGGKWSSLRARMEVRAKRCLDKTGLIGAVLGRHTLLVTMNVIVLNFSLSLISAIDRMGVATPSSRLLTMALELGCILCVGLILLIAVVTFKLCNAVVRQAEDAQ